ncbi:unnamed protein product [Bursaphelenchus okinawaensis]|uniref:DUF7753 domain-containing protein n=1 Tax=Bursaphelenchus okinawaensis TaxID=465554 RepID=A0A811KB43_9BILA|nr:unnamed protein product [Bursaphelenchus okinawaensis]CAG9096125.1 unnamed protein product [Bursaphelenchus okinawaensis]
MNYEKRLAFVVFLILLQIVQSVERFECNILEPACRRKLEQKARGISERKNNGQCNYQDLWLIPGRADASCTRPDAKKLVEIDPRQVKITPAIVKFPGCFTIEIKNVRILNDKDVLTNSFFAKSEYYWLNVKQFSELKCQNASNNGCGGYGNNCYYCDICESLNAATEVSDAVKIHNELTDQFKGLNCPKHAGLYTFKKEFCFNDWSSFDQNGDCQLDFLQTDQTDLKSALTSLQQIGYGTVVAKVRLAYNATGAIARKRDAKANQIKRMVERELAERKKSWDINRGQFEKFQQWYIDYRQNIWHREEYLPWLLYENELACLRLTFDVCERNPRPKPYGGQGYTCD